jgi:hypothetical protein
MGRLSHHITYANVASTIALVLALGGGSVYAAGKISGSEIEKGAVRSPQLKNREVKRQDIASGAINSKKVSNQSLTGKDVREDSLTGHDIEEGSLGLVPLAQDAQTVGGASVRAFRASQPSGAGTTVVLNQAGLVVLMLCPGGSTTMQVRGASSGDFGAVFDIDSGAVQEFNPGNTQTVPTAGSWNDGIASLHRADGTLTRFDFDLQSINNGYGSSDDCFLNGTLVSGR